MRVTEVRIDATFNKGNYESEKVGFTSLVDEGEDFRLVLKELRDFIYGKTEEVKASFEKEILQKIVEVPTEEEVVQEKPKKEKKVKEKFETYDRASNVHKKLFSQILDKCYPEWESQKDKAAAASRMMVGENFLDKEGQILPQFSEKVKKLMEV